MKYGKKLCSRDADMIHITTMHKIIIILSLTEQSFSIKVSFQYRMRNQVLLVAMAIRISVARDILW